METAEIAGLSDSFGARFWERLSPVLTQDSGGADAAVPLRNRKGSGGNPETLWLPGGEAQPRPGAIHMPPPYVLASCPQPAGPDGGRAADFVEEGEAPSRLRVGGGPADATQPRTSAKQRRRARRPLKDSGPTRRAPPGLQGRAAVTVWRRMAEERGSPGDAAAEKPPDADYVARLARATSRLALCAAEARRERLEATIRACAAEIRTKEARLDRLCLMRDRAASRGFGVQDVGDCIRKSEEALARLREAEADAHAEVEDEEKSRGRARAGTWAQTVSRSLERE